MTQEQLGKALFPIGDIHKNEVRRIAREQNFANANKKDSTGVCFIGERNFKKFLMEYLPAQRGDIVTEKGKVIGKHDGLMYYTLGQRRGLGIGGQADGTGESFFVIGKDLLRNLLIVQQGEHEELFSLSLDADKIHWIAGHAPKAEFDCTAKFRYRQSDRPVTVQVCGAGAHVRSMRRSVRSRRDNGSCSMTAKPAWAAARSTARNRRKRSEFSFEGRERRICIPAFFHL